MGRRCIVKKCGYSKSMGDDAFLMKIPDEAKFSKDWMKVIGADRPLRWLPKKGSKICSNHFPANRICRRTLLPGSIPLPLNSDIGLN